MQATLVVQLQRLQVPCPVDQPPQHRKRCRGLLRPCPKRRQKAEQRHLRPEPCRGWEPVLGRLTRAFPRLPRRPAFRPHLAVCQVVLLQLCPASCLRHLCAQHHQQLSPPALRLQGSLDPKRPSPQRCQRSTTMSPGENSWRTRQMKVRLPIQETILMKAAGQFTEIDIRTTWSC